MRRFNLTGALAAGQRQDLPTLRTHLTRRPREDISPPEQNSVISLSVQPKVQAALATAGPLLQRKSVPSRRNGVQDYGQAPGDCDDGTAHTTPLTAVRTDGGTVEREPHRAVELKPQKAGFRFTRRVRCQ